MRTINLSPRIFKNFSEVKTYFVVGQFSFDLSDSQMATEERQKLMQSLGLTSSQLVSLWQQHGIEVIDVVDETVDFLKPEILRADGLLTAKKDLYLVVKTADCLPILFYTAQKKVVGTIHAGWRGTERQILPNAINGLIERLNCPKEDFYFYFGPAAQKCCYGGSHGDFVQDNLNQLHTLGIKDSQIENSGICSIHNLNYPSHKREKQTRKEVILSIIGMK